MSSLRTKRDIQAHLSNVLQGNNKPRTAQDENNEESLSSTREVDLDNNEGETDDSERPLNNTENERDSPKRLDQLERSPVRGRLRTPFARAGNVVFNNNDLKVVVNEVAHKKFSRFNVDDHLYSVNFKVKQGRKVPYLLDIEEALEKSMIKVLDRLKASYNQAEDFQVYVTIIGRGIKSGINTGNYSLKSSSTKIVRWMLSMLYNFLKSKQTMKLNSTFHIKVKVLSVEHTNDLERRKRTFRKHIIRH